MWVSLWLRDWSAIGQRLRRDMILTNGVVASGSLCDENAAVYPAGVNCWTTDVSCESSVDYE